jgi:hypothetical protein
MNDVLSEIRLVGEHTMKMEETAVLGFVNVSARGAELRSVQDIVLVAIRVEFIPDLSIPNAGVDPLWVDGGHQHGHEKQLGMVTANYYRSASSSDRAC